MHFQLPLMADVTSIRQQLYILKQIRMDMCFLTSSMNVNLNILKFYSAEHQKLVFFFLLSFFLEKE